MVPEAPIQSRTLRQIFRLFVNPQCAPFRTVERLNAEGSSWTGGVPWNNHRVIDVLRYELVTGRQRYGKTTCMLGQPVRQNARETWGSVEGFSPIVSRGMFKAAQARLLALGGHRLKTESEMLKDLRPIYQQDGRVSVLLINEASGVPLDSGRVRRVHRSVRRSRRQTQHQSLLFEGEPPPKRVFAVHVADLSNYAHVGQ